MNTTTIQQTSIRFNHTLTVGPLAGVFFGPIYFRDRRRDKVNMHVWDNFKSRILASARPVSNQPSADLSAYTLTKHTYDTELRELPGNHIFGLDDLWMIGAAIALQPKGESGKLLTNGYANLFYIQVGRVVFAVNVRWSSGGGEWNVSAWRADEVGQWSKGGQVFSRNG